jgi:hypothetical protein
LLLPARWRAVFGSPILTVRRDWHFSRSWCGLRLTLFWQISPWQLASLSKLWI